MGYSTNLKAYRCYCPKTGKFIISRHVFFIESKDNTPHLFCPGVKIQADENQVNPFGQIDNEQALGGAQTIENWTLQENLPSVADANANDTNNDLGEDGNQYL